MGELEKGTKYRPPIRKYQIQANPSRFCLWLFFDILQNLIWRLDNRLKVFQKKRRLIS